MLQYSFNWKLLSVIAGISYWQFYFRLYPGTIKSAQVVEFLGHLRRQVRDYVANTDGEIELEFLPAYAPELNPSEQIFNHGKNREMANFCPTDFQHLRRFARRSFRRMQRRPALIAALWRPAELAF